MKLGGHGTGEGQARGFEGEDGMGAVRDLRMCALRAMYRRGGGRSAQRIRARHNRTTVWIEKCKSSAREAARDGTWHQHDAIVALTRPTGQKSRRSGGGCEG